MARTSPRRIGWAAAAALTLGASGALMAQTPALFKDADLPLGEKLIAQHKCSECHARKWADNGNAIYRPLGRINTPAALRTMVEYCDTQIGLNLFPEEVDAIAGVLNRDHYKFKK